MKYSMLFLLFFALLTLPGNAQTGGTLILSKQGTGSISGEVMSITLSAGPNCDQTQSKIPDGSKLVSDNLSITVGTSGVGTFYGSVRFIAPTGELLSVGFLRGSVGLNDCDPADQACTAVCTRPGRLEGFYEPFPSFAPNPNGDITLLHFKAELTQQSQAPEPLYRAQLNGLFADSSTPSPDISVLPDKAQYEPGETLKATITNKSQKTIRGNGARSAACTILDLERQENGRWVQYPTICPMIYFETDIRSGESLQVDVKLSNGGMPIEPGVYRLVLPHRIVDGETVHPTPSVVVSPSFQIGDNARRRIERTR